MSIEDLESDMNRNADELDSVTFASFDDVKAYLKQTMFPLMGNMVEELADIDNELAEYVEGRADMLQPQTAGIFAAVIVHCRQLIVTVKKLQPTNQKVLVKLEAIKKVCALAEQTLEEITVVPDSGEAEPDAANANAPVPPPAELEEEVLDGNAG